MAPAIQLHVGISGEFGPEDVRDAFADAFPSADLEADGERSLLVTIEDTPVAWNEIEAAYNGARIQIEQDHIQEEIEEGDVPVADQAEVAQRLSEMAIHGWVRAVDGAAPETLVMRVRLGSAVSEDRVREAVSTSAYDSGPPEDVFEDVSIEGDGRAVVLRNHIGGRATYGVLRDFASQLKTAFGDLSVAAITLDAEGTESVGPTSNALEGPPSGGGGDGSTDFADAIEDQGGIDTGWNAFGREGSYTREAAREQLEDWAEEYGAEKVVAALDGRYRLKDIPQNGIEKMVAQFSGDELESILTG